MAFYRSISRDFFTDERIVGMSPLARLLFISTWLEADREGRFVWRPNTLKLRYLPGDQCDIKSLARELVESGLVVPYEVDGQVYADIPSFDSMQVINNREAQSTIPPRDPDASPTRESRDPDASPTRESRDPDASPTRDGATGTPLVGMESKGEESTDTRRVTRDAMSSGFDAFWSAYPKKKAKEDALRAWSKLKPDGALQTIILRAIDHQRRTEDWLRDGGKFIPYPATWLNGRRWEDQAPAESTDSGDVPEWLKVGV